MAEQSSFPTMLSALIAELQGVLAEYGDMPVAAQHEYSPYVCAKLETTVEDERNEGCVLLPLDPTPYHVHRWVGSDSRRCVISADGPLHGFRTRPADTINGEPFARRQKVTD